MSAAAVTARLLLVSQLTRLCLSLKTAKIEDREVNEKKNVVGETPTPAKNKK